MGTYLEDYLESMYMLPSEIKRNFDLMRELDKTSYPLIEELRASHRAFLRSARATVAARCADTARGEPSEQELRALVEADAHLAALQRTRERAVQKLDEKIAIAAQSYDVVDHHIRRLDADLEAYAALLRAAGEFEEERGPRKRHKAAAAAAATALTQQQAQQAQQTQQTQAQGLAPPPPPATATAAQHTPQARSKASAAKGSTAGGATSAASGGRDRAAAAAQPSSAAGKASSAAHAAAGAAGSRKRSAADAALDAGALAAAMGVEDMPIDPNEPVYCSCRRVSFGQMVGCDNDDCKYEWFHFGCVGLTDQPQGQWFCPDCRAALGIK